MMEQRYYNNNYNGFPGGDDYYGNKGDPATAQAAAVAAAAAAAAAAAYGGGGGGGLPSAMGYDPARQQQQQQQQQQQAAMMAKEQYARYGAGNGACMPGVPVGGGGRLNGNMNWRPPTVASVPAPQNRGGYNAPNMNGRNQQPPPPPPPSQQQQQQQQQQQYMPTYDQYAQNMMMPMPLRLSVTAPSFIPKNTLPVRQNYPMDCQLPTHYGAEHYKNEVYRVLFGYSCSNFPAPGTHEYYRIAEDYATYGYDFGDFRNSSVPPHRICVQNELLHGMEAALQQQQQHHQQQQQIGAIEAPPQAPPAPDSGSLKFAANLLSPSSVHPLNTWQWKDH